MSENKTDPAIAALAPALSILAIDRGHTREELDALLASIETAATALPETLDGIATVMVSLHALLPWRNLVMDDGRTLNVGIDDLAHVGPLLSRALHRLAVTLAQHGGIAPQPLVRYSLEPMEAEVIRGIGERVQLRRWQAESDAEQEALQEAVTAKQPTPEIECVYARWTRAKGDMLTAYATVSTDDGKGADDAASEASDRLQAEAWAMVGTRAEIPRHIRLKVEAFRDQFEVDGTTRIDGLELALVNSIDTDLAALSS